MRHRIGLGTPLSDSAPHCVARLPRVATNFRWKLLQSSDFRLRCPECGRELELPPQAEGKTAQCPACEHRFVARRFSPETEPNAVKTPAITRAETAKSCRDSPGFRSRRLSNELSWSFRVAGKRLLWPFAWPFAMLLLFVGIPLLFFAEYYNTFPRTGCHLGGCVVATVFASSFVRGLVRAETQPLGLRPGL